MSNTDMNAGLTGTDPVGAFVPGERATASPLGHGVLDGVRLAVKDLFDIAGVVTTFGNPDWARTHAPAIATAPVVLALQEAGAALVGKTRTVELAFGMTGENIWHGTPLNPAAPDRFPGGSSCGSVAAVAGGLAELALGSDTGGSVRIPASYCGLFGLRPTHGLVSLAGALPLAPSLDTPGWFARDAETMARAAEVLLPPAPALGGPLLHVLESWEGAEPAVADALAPLLRALEALLGPALPIRLVAAGTDLNPIYRAVQGQEAWATQGGWITATRPSFSPAVAERFEIARRTDPAEAAAGRAFRRAWQARLGGLLAGGAILVVPTSPSPAPKLTADAEELARLRTVTIRTTAIAGLAGLPEVTIPGARVDGAPVGLSLIAAAGRDRALLDLARRLSA